MLSFKKKRMIDEVEWVLQQLATLQVSINHCSASRDNQREMQVKPMHDTDYYSHLHNSHRSVHLIYRYLHNKLHIKEIRLRQHNTAVFKLYILPKFHAVRWQDQDSLKAVNIHHWMHCICTPLPLDHRRMWVTSRPWFSFKIQSAISIKMNIYILL